MSLPEDVRRFYAPVIDWLKEYAESPREITTVNLKFDYLNTSSTKMVTELVFLIKPIADKGKKVKINWFYEITDYDMKKLGSDISFFADLTFEFVEVDEE
jgi:hypothetical protein